MAGGLLGRIVLASACLALVVVLGSVLGLGEQVGRAAQVAMTVGVDADPTGNSATELGEIDACVSVAVGESFEVDIFVADVVDLKGWQALLTYDPALLRATGLELFLGDADPSRLINISEEIPDEDGRYSIAAASLAAGTGYDGAGVVARVTLEAVEAGASPLTLEEIILGDSWADAIGDVTGDSFFDGEVVYAQVWVGEPCPGVLPTPTPAVQPTPTPEPPPVTPAAPSPTAATVEPGSPTPTAAASPSPAATPPYTPAEGEEDEEDGFPWAVAVGASVLAVVAVLAAGAGVRWWLQRGR